MINVPNKLLYEQLQPPPLDLMALSAEGTVDAAGLCCWAPAQLTKL